MKKPNQMFPRAKQLDLEEKKRELSEFKLNQLGLRAVSLPSLLWSTVQLLENGMDEMPDCSQLQSFKGWLQSGLTDHRALVSQREEDFAFYKSGAELLTLGRTSTSKSRCQIKKKN